MRRRLPGRGSSLARRAASSSVSATAKRPSLRAKTWPSPRSILALGTEMLEVRPVPSTCIVIEVSGGNSSEKRKLVSDMSTDILTASSGTGRLATASAMAASSRIVVKEKCSTMPRSKRSARYLRTSFTKIFGQNARSARPGMRPDWTATVRPPVRPRR